MKDIDCISAKHRDGSSVSPNLLHQNLGPHPALTRQHVLVICKQLMLISWVMTPCDLGCSKVHRHTFSN